MQTGGDWRTARKSFTPYSWKKSVPVKTVWTCWNKWCVSIQRLAGATLLVFANKQDLPGAMNVTDIKNVSQSTVAKNDIKLLMIGIGA